MALNWPHENRGGYLYVDGVSALDAARRFGTPLYLYSENTIRHQYRRIREAFSKHYPRSRVLYAAKANISLSILRILREEGAEIAPSAPGRPTPPYRQGTKPTRYPSRAQASASTSYFTSSTQASG